MLEEDLGGKKFNEVERIETTEAKKNPKQQQQQQQNNP